MKFSLHFQALVCAVLFLAGCKHSGTVIYDLAEQREAAFIPISSTQNDMDHFVQKDAAKQSFWVVEPYPSADVIVN